jgi:hypothetical protein
MILASKRKQKSRENILVQRIKKSEQSRGGVPQYIDADVTDGVLIKAIPRTIFKSAVSSGYR